MMIKMLQMKTKRDKGMVRMNNKKQKLELTWIGKDREMNLEPRILVEVPEKNYGDTNTENMLIHGDNLLALKALEQEYSGKIKCIYIDPPYNTGSAFEHYDDNVEHSTWLSLMKARLEILKNLLSDEGCIFVQIDDNEQAYLKVLMDEIFGRNNFINCISVKMSEASGVKMAHTEKRLPKLKEYILLYKKTNLLLNELKIKKDKWDDEYKTQIVDISREELNFVKEITKKETRTIAEIEKCKNILNKANYKSLAQIYKENNITSLTLQTKYNYENAYRIFQTVSMGSGTSLAINESRKKYCKNIFYPHLTSKNKMYIIKGDYDINMKKPRIQVLFADEYLTVNPCDLWNDIKTTGLDNEGCVDFKNSKKPEALIERVLTLASNKGDFVLDSFLGSGTTAAVAHKMGRRWIGIELGDHCYTHCEPRLQRVVDGTDQGGISKTVNWQGGGGYKFYELAPSLLKKDEFGEWIIEPKYDAEMLAEAMAKNEGYKYSPDGNNPYKQGYSTEKDFIFTTTQFITAELLNKIQHELKEDESLLICTTHYEENCIDKFSNVTVKKIPQSLLKRCEFGKLEYNLNVTEEEPRDTEDNDMEEDE